MIVAEDVDSPIHPLDQMRSYLGDFRNQISDMSNLANSTFASTNVYISLFSLSHGAQLCRFSRLFVRFGVASR